MINYSDWKPRIFPVLGDVESSEIDRVQGIDPTTALNRERVDEIGNANVVGYTKKSPTIGYRISQLEYGSIEFWQKIICSSVKGADGQSAITLDDFKTPYFDICGYLSDDSGAYRGTKMYPALRTSGFSIAIGEPQARIERSFDLVGESAITWQGANQYVIYGKHEVESADDDTIDLSGSGIPVPAVDPDNAGVSTVLAKGTGYTETSTSITVLATIATGDVIKYCYTSAVAPDVIFTPNTSDPSALLGDCVSIYLYIPATGKPSVSDYVYRLQSINFDVKFTREDLRELGNKEVVQRGIKENVVTANLGRILETFSIEEVLRGEVAGYGKIDVEKLSDEIALIVKVYKDNSKSEFAYGFKMTGMSPTDLKDGVTVREYVKTDNTLTGEELTISADESVIGID